MTKTCFGCGNPVLALGASELASARYWHGDCYRQHIHETHPDALRPGRVASSSHDDRVRDGSERP